MKCQCPFCEKKKKKKKRKENIINLSSDEFAHRVVYTIQLKRKSKIHTNRKKMLKTYHAIGQFSRISNSYFFLFSLENRSFLSPEDNLHEISICLFSGKISSIYHLLNLPIEWYIKYKQNTIQEKKQNTYMSCKQKTLTMQ